MGAAGAAGIAVDGTRRGMGGWQCWLPTTVRYVHGSVQWCTSCTDYGIQALALTKSPTEHMHGLRVKSNRTQDPEIRSACRDARHGRMSEYY